MHTYVCIYKLFMICLPWHCALWKLSKSDNIMVHIGESPAIPYMYTMSILLQLAFSGIFLLPGQPLSLVLEEGVVLHAPHGGVLAHEVGLGRAVLEQIEATQVVAEVFLLGAAVQDFG